jgi:anti-anti-sigma regulatory factor
MLRIELDDVNAHRVSLSLQGRIAGEWADLLEDECRELLLGGISVVLDLSGVVFVGRAGLEVLARLSAAGVRIVGASPLIAAMLKEQLR